MHPALQAFLDANADRFPDLKIRHYEEDGGFLKLAWESDDDSFADEITAFMLDNDTDPSFECDGAPADSGPDHFAKAVEVFAWRLLDSDEFRDVLSSASDSNVEPGTFGALVWTKAIDLHIDDMESTILRLRTERARLNPTTLADLPLFARDNTLVDVDDCDPHGPGVQCHACAAEE